MPRKSTKTQEEIQTQKIEAAISSVLSAAEALKSKVKKVKAMTQKPKPEVSPKEEQKQINIFDKTFDLAGCSLTEFDIYRCVDITIAQSNLATPDIEIAKQFDSPEAYEKWKERMTIRIEMFRNKLGVEETEKYIYKYVLKQPFPSSFDASTIQYLMQSLVDFKAIPVIAKKESKGRPRLPSVLKQYIKEYNKEKLKVYNNGKYQTFVKFKQLQKNCLTMKDIEELKSYLPKRFVKKSDLIFDKLEKIAKLYEFYAAADDDEAELKQQNDEESSEAENADGANAENVELVEA
jgi:hypothetical protein